MVVTSAQLRAARGLLNWTVRDLAERSGVHRNTVSRAEGDHADRGHAVAQMIRTMEAAGVEFTAGLGVRMLAKPHTMTLERFLNALDVYDPNQLKGNRGRAEPPKFALVLVHGDRNFADLVYEGKALGRVEWREGEVVFDPPLRRGRRTNAFDGDLDEWVALASARGTTGD